MSMNRCLGFVSNHSESYACAIFTLHCFRESKRDWFSFNYLELAMFRLRCYQMQDSGKSLRVFRFITPPNVRVFLAGCRPTHITGSLGYHMTSRRVFCYTSVNNLNSVLNLAAFTFFFCLSFAFFFLLAILLSSRGCSIFVS